MLIATSHQRSQQKQMFMMLMMMRSSNFIEVDEALARLAVLADKMAAERILIIRGGGGGGEGKLKKTVDGCLSRNSDRGQLSTCLSDHDVSRITSDVGGCERSALMLSPRFEGYTSQLQPPNPSSTSSLAVSSALPAPTYSLTSPFKYAPPSPSSAATDTAAPPPPTFINPIRRAEAIQQRVLLGGGSVGSHTNPNGREKDANVNYHPRHHCVNNDDADAAAIATLEALVEAERAKVRALMVEGDRLKALAALKKRK